tara:strand:- start:4 stop:981 length:978 start_codon:yes stop_codon:yes gene_type:complete
VNGPTLFKLIRSGDLEQSDSVIAKASKGGDALVQYLNYMLLYAASVKWDKNIDSHPIVIINSVKNILSDNIEKPSITLLTFCFNILSKLPLRDNDEYYIKKVEKEGVGLAVFIGEFEDTIQSGDRGKAEILAAKFFLASDKSRAIIDSLAELGFQNINSNGLFIFHLLRAFNFMQKKSQIWTYACCLMNIIKLKKLPNPHKRRDFMPESLINDIPYNYDIKTWVILAAMLRVWNNDYVRQDGYRREISHWLYLLKTNIDKSEVKGISNYPGLNIFHNNFIKIAEEIISKNKMPDNIIALDGLRYLSKIKNKNIINVLDYHLKKLR